MDTSNEFMPTYISGMASTTVYDGRCTLGSIIIGTTANGAISVYDAGTLKGTLKASIAEGVYPFNCKIANKLDIVTAASPTITVTWRV